MGKVYQLLTVFAKARMHLNSDVKTSIPSLSILKLLKPSTSLLYRTEKELY
jgi:hypothetical protein